MEQFKRFYMAIPKRGKFEVWYQVLLNTEIPYIFSDLIPVGGVRNFDTFSEADICSKRIASGEFGDTKGEYVCNR